MVVRDDVVGHLHALVAPLEGERGSQVDGEVLWAAEEQVQGLLVPVEDLERDGGAELGEQ